MRSSRVIVVLLVLNILVVGTALAFFFMTERPFTNSVHAAQDDSARQASVKLADPSVYQFLPVEKIIIGVRGAKREHYVVIDLALQASAKIEGKELQPVVPLVRNSVVAQLSGMRYETLRKMSIIELQDLIEQGLFDDFTARRLKAPFERVLVSKMLVQ